MAYQLQGGSSPLPTAAYEGHPTPRSPKTPSAAATISPSTINIMALDCASLPSQSSLQLFKGGSGVKTKKDTGRFPTVHSRSICSTSWVFASIFVLECPQPNPPRHGLPFWKHNAAWSWFLGGGRRGRVSAKRRTSAMPSAPRSLRRSPRTSVHVHHPEAHTTAEHRSPGPSPRPEPGAPPA